MLNLAIHFLDVKYYKRSGDPETDALSRLLETSPYTDQFSQIIEKI